MRELRPLRGIALQRLAGRVGAAFQQLQKYESAANRISASRLYQFARVLNVPITWFYEGLDASRGNEANVSRLARDPEFTRFVRAYYQIKNVAARRRLREMVSVLAGEG